VNAHPADWFAVGAQPVLAQLCRHIDAVHKIAQLVRQFEDGDAFDVDGWLAMLRAQDRESGRIAQLATKLRLTPQSRYTPHGAAVRADRDAGGKKPWEG